MDAAVSSPCGARFRGFSELFRTPIHCRGMPEQSATSPPLPRESVPDLVFGRLCEAILGGQYQPGERLPTQRALAADLGVNIATVREAVKRLEQLRLVDVRHGDAMRVLDWRGGGGPRGPPRPPSAGAGGAPAPVGGPGPPPPAAA